MASSLNVAWPEPAFDPEAITVLAAAFDEAWDRLRQSGSECVRPAYARAMKEILARRIIEMAQRGTTDQQELVAGATRFITTNYRLKTISPDIPVRPGRLCRLRQIGLERCGSFEFVRCNKRRRTTACKLVIDNFTTTNSISCPIMFVPLLDGVAAAVGP